VEGDRLNELAAYLKFLLEIAGRAAVIFLFVGAVLALIAGILLIVDSQRALRISDWLNRWVSTRSALRPLEAHRSIARPLYRMHRLVGTFICAGALYSLAVLGSAKGEAAILHSLGSLGPARFSAWLSESLRYILLTGNFAALLFGLVFIVRPSALKRLESWADRSISARKSTKPLEEMHQPVDRFVRAYPRLVGMLVCLGSAFILANLGYALLR
jgi:hypothetical protein